MAKYEKNEKNTDGLRLLRQQLREKTPGRLYFFHGEETFLLHYYLDQLRKLLIDPLTESFNYHKLNNETFSVAEFANCVENLPMMAESTLVVVDEVNLFALPEADRGKIVEIISDIPEYCTVVFSYVTEAWEPDKRQKKFYEALMTYGVAVEFYKQDQKDLIPWVSRHFAADGKKIAPNLCAYLIEITDGTMTSLTGEIAKICAYSASEEICKSDIDAVTEPVLDALVYQMTDLMGRGEYGAAIQKLHQLRKMQETPLSILGMIGSHFRRMSAAKTLLSAGRGSAELRELYHLSDYAARKTMDSAAKFSARFYKSASQHILETDYRMKTSYDDPDRLLELLIMDLAQEARNG